MRLPVVGELFHIISIERFCRVLAALAKAGVPLPDAIEMSAASTNNSIFEEKLVAVRDTLIRGGGLSGPVVESGIFPVAARQMIRVGERTGSLGHQLTKAAGYYEREVTFQMKRATDLFQPAVILFVGLMVGFVAVAQVERDVQHLQPGAGLTTMHPTPAARQKAGRNMKAMNDTMTGRAARRADRIEAEVRVDQGFTLMEIVIAIALVGILSAVAVVGIGSLTSKGSKSACTSSLDAAKAASVVHFAGERGVPHLDDPDDHHEPGRADPADRCDAERQRPRGDRQRLDAHDDRGCQRPAADLRLHLTRRPDRDTSHPDASAPTRRTSSRHRAGLVTPARRWSRSC